MAHPQPGTPALWRQNLHQLRVKLLTACISHIQTAFSSSHSQTTFTTVSRFKNLTIPSGDGPITSFPRLPLLSLARQCIGPAFCKPSGKNSWPTGQKTLTENQFYEKEKGHTGIYICLFFVQYSRNPWGNKVQAHSKPVSYTFTCPLRHPELVLSITVCFHTFLQPFERLPWVTAQ